MKKSKAEVRKVQYVIPVGNAWAIKASDKTKFTLLTLNKREAVTIAKNFAERYQHDLIIYGKDGQVSAKSRYSKRTKSLIAKAV